MERVRVGIVGFGSLGRYLAKAILTDPRVSARFQIVFVWNRTASAFDEDLDFALDRSLILENLEEFHTRKADFIIEVAHPSITQQYGLRFLSASDYFVGSPTAFADASVGTSAFEILFLLVVLVSFFSPV
jgi:predicted dinucleotide-utilizing enzyme